MSQLNLTTKATHLTMQLTHPNTPINGSFDDKSCKNLLEAKISDLMRLTS